MKRVQARITELKLLSTCKTKLRKAILTNSDADLIKVLRECVYNLLKGNLKVPKEVNGKLNKYKNVLRNFVYEKKSLQNKKKYLVQKGGFLQYLLPVVVDLAVRGISNVLNK